MIMFSFAHVQHVLAILTIKTGPTGITHPPSSVKLLHVCSKGGVIHIEFREGHPLLWVEQ